jgi:beta-lactamase superfamily II metal-dependent hydrolase
LSCEALHPNDRFVAAPGLSANDRSVVLLCSFGGSTLLLTGDVEGVSLARLAADHGSGLRADVLLLPHHGAWDPGLPGLVKLVRPKVAVASCFEAIDQRTQRMLEELGVPLWTTARHGAVIITVEGGELLLSGFRSGRRVRLTPGDGHGAMPPGSRESTGEDS